MKPEDLKVYIMGQEIVGSTGYGGSYMPRRSSMNFKKEVQNEILSKFEAGEKDITITTDQGETIGEVYSITIYPDHVAINFQY